MPGGYIANETMSAEELTGFKGAVTPTHSQFVHLYILLAYFLVLLIGWNLRGFRTLIFPLKIITVAFHEGCHAIVATLTGATVRSIQLDPNQGGATRMVGGLAFLSLPAGYIGSSAIGSALIFASFDQKASEIACIPILCVMAAVAFWARKDWFTLAHLSGVLGVMVILYFVAHGVFLRFFILLVGTMNVMYSIWDTLDDLIFHKIEASDCSQFTSLYGMLPSQVWGAIWFTVSFSALAAGLIGGLVTFKADFDQQAVAAAGFIDQ